MLLPSAADVVCCELRHLCLPYSGIFLPDFSLMILNIGFWKNMKYFLKLLDRLDKSFVQAVQVRLDSEYIVRKSLLDRSVGVIAI